MKKIFHQKWIYLIFIFLFMLLFNHFTFYLMDDFEYMERVPIHHIGDLIVALKNFYFQWGGRVLAHLFAFTFLSLPKWIFNLVNSLVYTLNIYLVYLIVFHQQKEQKPYYLLLIHVLIFVFFPSFFQSFLWVDGSCNYSFTVLFQLLFLYFLLSQKKLHPALFFFLGFLAGMCNENSSLSVLVFMVLWMIYQHKLWKKYMVPFVGLVLGYCFLFFAPGNFARMATSNTTFFANFIDKLLFLGKISLPLIPFMILVYVVLRKNKDQFLLCVGLFISLLVSIFSMIISPILNLRSFTFTCFYILIICLFMIRSISSKWLLRSFLVLISIVFLYVTVITFGEFYTLHQLIDERASVIEKAKVDQEELVLVKKYPYSHNCRTPYSCELVDLHEDWDVFPNTYMAQFYGVSKIAGY